MKPLNLFSFVYVSGGWWRKADVARGVSAPMLHGDAAIERALLEQRTGSDMPVTFADPRLAQQEAP